MVQEPSITDSGTQGDTVSTTDNVTSARRSYYFYDTISRMYGMTLQKVSALTRQHDLNRTKIYGCQAVDAVEWDRLMAQMGISPAQGYSPAK